jgi:hypothetical protein
MRNHILKINIKMTLNIENKKQKTRERYQKNKEKKIRLNKENK